MTRIIKYLLFLPFFISCTTQGDEKEKSEINETISDNGLKNAAYKEEGGFNEGIDKKSYDFTLSPMEFRKWVNSSSSPLIKHKKIAEYNYELKYIPVEYMISNEIKKPTISKKVYDSLITDYEGMEYFELKLYIDHFNDEPAKYKIVDMSFYQQRIMYLSFAMQNDLFIELNDTTIPCKLFHNERIYGVAPYSKFLFGFSKENIGNNYKDITVVFNDKLFNTGKIKFNWDRITLENIPQMKLS